ncbi:E3 SUMO-protein ligase pli1 [Neolecta irregularis DAH-3]|uniref:E3 SUMO-protein ligase pli1 n=1 Tax=Neolecta irregularis (strain DAH-3) TaxID=1198029 RepID=A0A1U7LWK7_NEOID|nr:E3 SUMO-protein ligase pli1 [Neolecta irregularis DAH-3]|eukprot:OLL27009.1 E3 SUMO-protein ligase pli1 [Neolecta irregularis DAH-3]
MTVSAIFEDKQQVLGYINNFLLVFHLKNILDKCGLSKTGNKSSLIIRLSAHIDRISEGGNLVAWETLKTYIAAEVSDKIGRNFTFSGGNTAPRTPALHGYIPGAGAYYPPYNHSTPPHRMTAQRPSLAPALRMIQFKSSPFYTVLESLHNPIHSSSNRTTVYANIKLEPLHIEKLQSRDLSNQHRIYVFCTPITAILPQQQHLVEFPIPVEIRINNEPLNVNVRGLKNKPGTTRPPDITSKLVIDRHVHNKIELAYAYAQKDYNLVVNLVKVFSVDALTKQIEQGYFISKESTIARMKSEAEDTDIVTTSSIITLKCPISYSRIVTPCRSSHCQHIQCFDAASFLMLNEMTPTWQCPVCNRSIAGLQDIVVDGYVRDILENTSKSVESVTIDPNGAWKLKDIDEEDAPSDSEESESTRPKSKAKTPAADVIDLDNQPLARRQHQAVGTSKKRAMAEVIDLTSDNDEPVAPVKKTRRSESIAAPNSDSGNTILPPSHDPVTFAAPSKTLFLTPSSHILLQGSQDVLQNNKYARFPAG